MYFQSCCKTGFIAISAVIFYDTICCFMVLYFILVAAQRTLLLSSLNKILKYNFHQDATHPMDIFSQHTFKSRLVLLFAPFKSGPWIVDVENIIRLVKLVLSEAAKLLSFLVMTKARFRLSYLGVITRFMNKSCASHSHFHPSFLAHLNGGHKSPVNHSFPFGTNLDIKPWFKLV